MSDPQPDPTPAPEPAPTPAPEPAEDAAAELAKWKHFAREHEKAAKANAEAAKRLAEIEAASLTQQEQDAKARAEAEGRAVKAEAELLRLRTAAARGIPADKAHLISGTTEDEMTAAADDLVALMAPATPPPPPPPGDGDGGPRGTQEQETIDDRIAAAIKAGNNRLAISLNTQKLAAIHAAGT